MARIPKKLARALSEDEQLRRYFDARENEVRKAARLIRVERIGADGVRHVLRVDHVHVTPEGMFVTCS